MPLADQMDYRNMCTSRELEANLRVEVFKGSTSSTKAYEWISRLIDCFRIIKCPQDQEVKLAKTMLGREARDW